MANDTLKSMCTWSGCSGFADATLEGRALCRSHFYEVAEKRLEEYRIALQRTPLVPRDRIAISQFLSELISQTTLLAATAKLLAPSQRDQFYELSLAAAEVFKRVQRSHRILRSVPILIYRKTDSSRERELATTVDVSVQGACVATNRSWERGERIWTENPANRMRVQARIAWVRTNASHLTLIGIEILDCEDFWGLGSASSARKGHNADLPS